MKISDETFDVLKNFSEIEKSIFIEKGNVLETKNLAVLAKAKVAEKFPVDFCIYELPQFLGAISLFEEPEFEFGEKSVEVIECDHKLVYRYTDPALVPRLQKLPEKEITHTINIAAKDLHKLIKAARVINAEHIFVEADGQKVSVIAKNKHILNHEYRQVLGKCSFQPYIFPVAVSRLTLLPLDYTLGFGQIKAINLSTSLEDGRNISYWIAADTDV